MATEVTGKFRIHVGGKKVYLKVASEALNHPKHDGVQPPITHVLQVSGIPVGLHVWESWKVLGMDRDVLVQNRSRRFRSWRPDGPRQRNVCPLVIHVMHHRDIIHLQSDTGIDPVLGKTLDGKRACQEFQSLDVQATFLQGPKFPSTQTLAVCSPAVGASIRVDRGLWEGTKQALPFNPSIFRIHQESLALASWSSKIQFHRTPPHAGGLFEVLEHSVVEGGRKNCQSRGGKECSDPGQVPEHDLGLCQNPPDLLADRTQLEGRGLMEVETESTKKPRNSMVVEGVRFHFSKYRRNM